MGSYGALIYGIYIYIYSLLVLRFCSSAEIVGSNPAGGHGCLSVVSVVFFSVKSLCEELIACPEEIHRLWCVVVCDLETSRMSSPWPAIVRSATGRRQKIFIKVDSNYI